MSFTKQKISCLNLIIKNDIGHALGKPHRHLKKISIFSLRRPAPAQCHALNGPL